VSDRLPLYQELWLLGHDEHGTPHIHLPCLNIGLAGAVLTELVMAERITLRASTICVYDRKGVGEPLLDATRTAIVNERGQRQLSTWLRWIAEDIYERTTGALIASGIVVRDVSRRHLLSRRERYRPTDPLAASRSRGAVTYAVRGQDNPDWQCVALCGLLGVLSLQDVLYLAGSPTELRNRLQQIGRWHHQDIQAILATVDRLLGDVAVAAVR
jgi:Golgi phosphoprotein 3 GPP34